MPLHRHKRRDDRSPIVGNAISAEYSAYQHLVTERQIAQERIWAEEDDMDSGLWGPWYWR